MISFKHLGYGVLVLTLIAILLSFTGYPKLLSTHTELNLNAQNPSILIHVKKISQDTTKHLLKNSSSYNIILSIELQAHTDVRLENTNFWINCFHQHTLVNCTDGKTQSLDENQKFIFNRKFSRLTKTPLNTTLTEKSVLFEYQPEFFGIDFSVDSIALVYAQKPYSRTDLVATKEPDLMIPIKVDRLDELQSK